MAIGLWLASVQQVLWSVFGLRPSLRRRRPDPENPFPVQNDLPPSTDSDSRDRVDAHAPCSPRFQTPWHRVLPTPPLRDWLRSAWRTTTTAMRPEALKELLWQGFAFLSERLLPRAASWDNHEYDHNHSRHDPPTVERIIPPSRPPLPTPDAATYAPPLLVYGKDHELVWRDDPRNYISLAGFEAVASLLRAWRDDIEAGSVARCPSPDPIVRRFDDVTPHRETRLSAVIHNYMLERSGTNTDQAWQDAVVTFAASIDATDRWIATLYTSTTVFETIKTRGVVPYEALRASAQQLSDGGCGLCAIGDFLAFAILQTQQWGHPGMYASQTAMMKMLVDLEAFHCQLPLLSFVLVQRVPRAPGYLFDDADRVTVLVTAEELSNLWYHGSTDDASNRAPATGARRTGLCRVFGEHAPPSPEALRRARIIRAAAKSIKSARRSADGRRPLVIAPSQTLLYERYRRLSSSTEAADLLVHPDSTYSGVKECQIPAKRKAKTATPEPRTAKRSCSDRKTRTELLSAWATPEAAAAAAIPFPPSPASTTASSDEDLDEPRQRQHDPQQHQRRLPWTENCSAELDDKDGESLGLPRLRISVAKSEELRLLAEQKRATEKAARLRRDAERRRKEEERLRKEAEELAKSTGLRRPRHAAIAPLSDEWHMRVSATLRADPGRDVAKSPEGTALTSKDFRTVVSKSEWLNDEIVNGFLLHLANDINLRAGIVNVKTQTPKCHAFTSFFWKPLSMKGAAGTLRWMKRVGVTKDNFMDINTILIPICEHSHWTLVVVRPTRATVTHMDSLGPRGQGRTAVTDLVLRWVRDLLGDGPFAARKWRVQQVESPRQTNGWDCGVHTLTNALFMSLGLDPAYYASIEMPLQRDRIAATLLNGGFTGDLELASL